MESFCHSERSEESFPQSTQARPFVILSKAAVILSAAKNLFRKAPKLAHPVILSKAKNLFRSAESPAKHP
ncbi:MAG: hypothetical protein RR900_08265, partial [Ruthenibacterium sp.]